MTSPKRIIVALVLSFGLFGLANAEAPNYATQVQPIFAKHCYECHGAETQESNFRLDVRERAFAEADIGRPIVKGHSDQSPLIQYVSGSDPDLTMPPEDDGVKLLPAEVEVLRQWIDAGAPWPDDLAGDAEIRLTTDHWSFQPISKSEPPATKSHWPHNGIDQYILAKLTAHNLAPSAQADRIQFIRRLFLDMHGLPPTPAQVADFVNDQSDDAYAKIVDKVLESPRYGERWARHWLDVARFGESTGYEVNRDRENAYHYRDYVIESLNRDKSFRDFVIEQLAGDAVGAAGADVGTGFLVGGPYDMVKSPDVNLTLMQRQDELADYVNTTATAFLGLTVGCARCHNHKFDPILQRDYYSMQAVFAGVQHGEREITTPEAAQKKERIKDLRAKQKSIGDRLAELRENSLPKNAATPRPPVDFQENIERLDPVQAKFIRFTILGTTGGEPCIDEFEVFAGNDRDLALAELGAKVTVSGTLPGYKIHQPEHLTDGKHGNNHSWISNTNGGGWFQIELAETHSIERIHWGRDRTGRVKDRLATSYVIEAATVLGEWKRIASSDDRQPTESNASKYAFVERLPAEKKALARELLAESNKMETEIGSLSKRLQAYIGNFRKPEIIHRLYRGDPSAPREVVVPDALTVLGSLGMTNETGEQQRRLKLAQWIASDENPLTARVIVNRVWHYHFGIGIVSTPSDLGKNGAKPSHPELLDWLAKNFMQNDWSLKWLHRKIVMSATYRQSSKPRTEALAKDANCRLLWRFPPRRLEAEAIRDCVLHVSGALEHRGGGPGFLLLDIDHENVHHYFAKSDLGPNEFRRMVYMTKIRQEQDAVFGVFDCPDGGQVIPKSQSFNDTTPSSELTQ